MTSRLLLIGGRSGVGKSTVAFALHDLLTDREIPHAVIEGDALDLAQREHGASLTDHMERSTLMAGFLDAKAPVDVHRLSTDGRTPEDLATAIAELSGWHPAD